MPEANGSTGRNRTTWDSLECQLQTGDGSLRSNASQMPWQIITWLNDEIHTKVWKRVFPERMNKAS